MKGKWHLVAPSERSRVQTRQQGHVGGWNCCSSSAQCSLAGIGRERQGTLPLGTQQKSLADHEALPRASCMHTLTCACTNTTHTHTHTHTHESHDRHTHTHTSLMKLGWWALPLPSSLSLTHLKAVQPPAPKPHVTTEHLKYS